MYAEDRKREILRSPRPGPGPMWAGLADEPSTSRRDHPARPQQPWRGPASSAINTAGRSSVERNSFEPACDALHLSIARRTVIAKLALSEVPTRAPSSSTRHHHSGGWQQYCPRPASYGRWGTPPLISPPDRTRKNLTSWCWGAVSAARRSPAVDELVAAAPRRLYVDVAFLGIHQRHLGQPPHHADPSEARASWR